MQIVITEISTANSKDYSFKLDYNVPLSQYTKPQQAGIQRKYSEFQQLYSNLQSLHVECVLPALPPMKSQFTFTTVSQEYVDQHCKDMLQRFMDCLLQHSTFRQSPELQSFLETQGGTGAGSETSVSKKGSVGSFLKNMTSSNKPSQEIDSWYETNRMDIQTLATIFDKCQRSSEKVSKQHRSVGAAYLDTYPKFNDLGALETNSRASMALRKLSFALEKCGAIRGEQGDMELMHVTDAFNRLIKLCESGIKVFDNRSSILASYENACRNSLKKKQACEKLKTASQVRTDKVDAAVAELNEATLAENESKDQLKKISDSIRAVEMPQFKRELFDDLNAILASHARDGKNAEERLLTEFSAMLNELGSRGDSVGGVASTTVPATTKIAAEVL